MVYHKHHKSPVVHFIGAISCLLSAIGAINWGLVAMDKNLLSYLPANFQTPALYVIGVAGVISLLMFLMHLAKGTDCKC